MCRRLSYLFSFVLIFGLAGNASAYFGDDFESYSDTPDLKNTWDPTGATETYYKLTMGYIHAGMKALELSFYNFEFPYYCGVSRTDLPSDWTLNGTAAGLSFWFRGDPAIDQMYVKITDSDDREAVVRYSDAWDPNDLVLVQWQQWDIILRYFIENNPSFNMTAVETLEIGVGEPDSSVPGDPAVGFVYIDDIELHKCLYQSQIDLNGDCVIDWLDVIIFAGDWLDQGGAPADMDSDGGVNFRDYSIMAGYWLEEAQEFIPQGRSGIASNYIGDVGIESNPSVILYEDFETRDIGTLTPYWTEVDNDADELEISSEVPPSSPGSRSLKNTSRRGIGKDGGAVKKLFPSKYNELYARFYVKFAYDFGFMHHFCKLGTEMGGGAGQRPTDRFWTGLEPSTELSHYYPSTEYPPPGFWHFYTYWPHMKSWQTPEGVPDPCNSLPPYYGNDFSPQVPTFVPRNEWICVEYMMRANSDTSDPENSDGVQRFWINGELIGNWAPGTPIGYWYRATFRLDPADPRSGPFEGYRWRDFPSVGLEYFKIENYVSDTAFQSSEQYKIDNPGFVINDQEATCWFDHVVVATSYIGPIQQ